MTDLELIESLAKLDAEANKNEWRAVGGNVCEMFRGYLPNGLFEQGPFGTDNDAALIAAMRNALPRLLILARIVDGLKAANAQLLADNSTLQKQMACEVSVNADYPDVVDERDALASELKLIKHKHVSLCEQLDTAAAERDAALARVKAMEAHNALQQATLHDLHARMKTKDDRVQELEAVCECNEYIRSLESALQQVHAIALHGKSVSQDLQSIVGITEAVLSNQ